jgi:hypothetical protein
VSGIGGRAVFLLNWRSSGFHFRSSAAGHEQHAGKLRADCNQFWHNLKHTSFALLPRAEIDRKSCEARAQKQFEGGDASLRGKGSLRNENEAACTETQFICLEMRKTNAHKEIVATLYTII